MKKGLLWVVAFAFALALAGCSGASGSGPETDTAQTNEPAATAVQIKESPDKYTWYIKNYVGMNAASVGYTSLDGMRRDAYGDGTLKIVFEASDGSYVNHNVLNEEGESDENSDVQLREYVITGQDLAPNTELKYTYQIDDNGEEYDNLIDCQNYEEIVLTVSKVGENDSPASLTPIEPSPDKYTRYVKNYVGRNLATCGYVSLGGTYNDHYGQGYIQFDLTAEDGSYIDINDEASLSNYVVTGQSVEPNSAIQFTFSKDSEGNDSNLVDSQSISFINLIVKPLSE